jgi:murein DD-endopeptidase MepM/ murein hydrolase activator NlpD
MIQEIAEADTTRLEALEKVSREVETAKTILAQEKVTLDLAREEMEKKQVQLAQKQEEASALLLELLAKGQEYEDLVEKSEEAMEEMQEALEAMELKLSEAEKREYEEMLRQQEEEAKKNQTTEERPTYNKGDITWALPCDYNRVSSPFGYRYHPVTGKWKGHTGVDLTPPKGTAWNEKVPIYATRSGVVVYAGWDSGGGGNYVSIDHLDNYKSQYMHLESMVVKTGDTVTIGQLIGYMGNTGTSTGRHLHFTIRHYENYEKSPGKWSWGWRPLNPAEFINFK